MSCCKRPRDLLLLLTRCSVTSTHGMQVYDKDTFSSDDFLGFVALNLGDLQANNAGQPAAQRLRHPPSSSPLPPLSAPLSAPCSSSARFPVSLTFMVSHKVSDEQRQNRSALDE